MAEKTWLKDGNDVVIAPNTYAECIFNKDGSLYTKNNTDWVDITNTEYFPAGTVMAKRNGDVLNIYLKYAQALKEMSTANGYCNIGYLPESMKPKHWILQMINMGSYNSQIDIWNGTDVRIGYTTFIATSVTKNIQAGDWLFFNYTFII